MNSSFINLHDIKDDFHIRNPFQSISLKKTYLKYPKLLPAVAMGNNRNIGINVNSGNNNRNNMEIFKTNIELNHDNLLEAQFDLQTNSFSSTYSPNQNLYQNSPRMKNMNNKHSIKKAMINAQKERMQFNKIFGYISNEYKKEQRQSLENFSLTHAKKLNLMHKLNHKQYDRNLGNLQNKTNKTNLFRNMRNKSNLVNISLECKMSQEYKANNSANSPKNISKYISKNNKSISSLQNSNSLILDNINYTNPNYKNNTIENSYLRNHSIKSCKRQINQSLDLIDKIITKNNSLPLLLTTCKNNVNIFLGRRKVNDLPIYPSPLCFFQNKYSSKSEETRYSNIINELLRIRNMIEVDSKNANKIIKEYLLFNHINPKYITTITIVNFTKFIFSDFWKVISPNQNHKEFLMEILQNKAIKKIKKESLPKNRSMIDMTNYVSPFIKEYKNTFVKKNFNVKILNDIHENLEKQTFFRKKLAALKKEVPLTVEENIQVLQNDINLGIKEYNKRHKYCISKKDLEKKDVNKNSFFITNDKCNDLKSTSSTMLNMMNNLNGLNALNKTKFLDYKLRKTVEEFGKCVPSYHELKRTNKLTEYGVLKTLKKKVINSYNNQLLKC